MLSSKENPTSFTEGKRWRPVGWRPAVRKLVGVAGAGLAVALLPGCDNGADVKRAPAATSSTVSEAQPLAVETEVPYIGGLLSELEPGGQADLSAATMAGLELLQVGDLAGAQVYTLPKFTMLRQNSFRDEVFTPIVIEPGAQVVESPNGDVIAVTLPQHGRFFVCSPDSSVEAWNNKYFALDTALKAADKIITLQDPDTIAIVEVDWGNYSIQGTTTARCAGVVA